MDTPQISIETNGSEIHEKIDNPSIIKKKNYKLEINNNKFNLNITINNKSINFKLHQINDIIFYYKNHFNLNDIVNKLEISHKLYNDLEKVMDLIDNCYHNNKLSIKFNTNDKINMILKYPLGITPPFATSE